MATLWAEARLGELLGGIDKKYVSSGKGTIEKLPSLPPGIDKKTSFIAQEVVEVTDVEKSETMVSGFPHMVRMPSFKICPRRGRFQPGGVLGRVSPKKARRRDFSEMSYQGKCHIPCLKALFGGYCHQPSSRIGPRKPILRYPGAKNGLFLQRGESHAVGEVG